jgi:hypothetical protein
MMWVSLGVAVVGFLWLVVGQLLAQLLLFQL